MFSYNKKKVLPKVSDENYLKTMPSQPFQSALLYLDISSNNLREIPLLPENLKIFNLSNNFVSELRIPSSSIYINANNNEISLVSIEKGCLLEEFYISHNKLERLSGFNKLLHLNILDLSENFLESGESLAILAWNTKLAILSVNNNPADYNFDYSISQILPNLIYLNPTNIFSYSNCPYSSILQSSSSSVHKRHYTLPLDFTEIPCPRQPCKPNYKNSRSSSPSLLNFCYTNKSVCFTSSPLYKENDLERKTTNYCQRKSSSVLITPENIVKATKIKYGNPIAALMIKPGSKRRLLRKK